MANAEKEIPSQASRAEAVAEAGMGAHDRPPTASPASDAGGVKNGEQASPSSSPDGVEANDEKPVAAHEEEPKMSTAKIALIMLALCVRCLISCIRLPADIGLRSLSSWPLWTL